MDRSVRTSPSGGWHSGDLCYAALSCSPPLGPVISARYPTPMGLMPPPRPVIGARYPMPMGLIADAQYSTQQLGPTQKVTFP